MPDFLHGPTPHLAAREFLEGKPVVSREVFDEMIPEIRGRTFLITGIEDHNLVQDIRDRVADLTVGDDWDAIKNEVAAHLSPWLGDGAVKRAELLLRTHGYQAYAATEQAVLARHRDVFPYLQYQAVGDGRVRDSHQALDGLVLPADDEFWKTHYPPWEFGCRCQVIPLQEEDVADIRAEDAEKPPEEQRIVEGSRLEKIKEGTLMSSVNGIPRQVDVRAPSESLGGSGFSASPGTLRIPLAELEKKYDAPTWNAFAQAAEAAEVSEGVSVMAWLQAGEKAAG